MNIGTTAFKRWPWWKEQERTGKSRIGSREGFIQFQVGDTQEQKSKKDNRMAGFFPRDVEFWAASECERRHVSRDERDGMSAISRRSFMELEVGDNKGWINKKRQKRGGSLHDDRGGNVGFGESREYQEKARQKARSPRQVNHNNDSTKREVEQIYANEMGICLIVEVS